MNDHTATIDTLFGFTRDRTSAGGAAAGPDADVPAARVEASVRKASRDRIATVSSAAMIAAIAGLLNVPLVDILVRAWNEGKLFRKYLDPERYDPDEVISITLKKHEVSSTHRPKIDVELNGVTVDTIDFELDVALMLEGVILDVQGGEVRKIRAGRIKGECVVKCEGLVVFKRETEPVELPGIVQFPPPRAAGA